MKDFWFCKSKEQLPVTPKLLCKIHYCKPISRILSGAIIYLVPALLTESICLPFPVFPEGKFHRAGKKQGYTWHFSTQGLPIPQVTLKDCELLPHIFTLIPPVAGRLFSVALSSRLRRDRRLTGVLPFAVRTFLLVWP